MQHGCQAVLKAPGSGSGILLSGPTGSGKTTLLIKRYCYMIQTLGIPSEGILVILLNRAQVLRWRREIFLSGSGRLWLTSYFAFLLSELRMYWPIVLDNCPHIKRHETEPHFLSTEQVEYLLSSAIENRRHKEGYFDGITAQSARIAKDIETALVNSAVSGIPAERIGNLFYSSLEKKDDTHRQIYDDMDEVIDAYRKKCMQLGVFDLGMAVELFNSYLLKNEKYFSVLKGRVQHILIDNAEEALPCVSDLADKLMPHIRTCIFACNTEGSFRPGFGDSSLYATGKFEEFKLDDTHTSDRGLKYYADRLYSRISGKDCSKPQPQSLSSEILEKCAPELLRSRMLEKAGMRICSLIEKEGYEPSDIAVLSTYADPVTGYVLERILASRGLKLANMAAKQGITDNCCSKALVTFTRLCRPCYGMPPDRQDVRELVTMIYGSDPVRSDLAAKNLLMKKESGVPESLIKVIQRYGSMTEVPLNEFLYRAFVEVILSERTGKNDIIQIKMLIDSAGEFVDTVSRFGIDAEKQFVRLAASGGKLEKNRFELEEKLYGSKVLLTTAAGYLGFPVFKKVLVILSASSENWYPGTIRGMTNPHVLSRAWKEGEIYTEEMEQKNRMELLAKRFRAVIRRCSEKLIIFESQMSGAGFENRGMLSEFFDEAAGDITWL